MDSQPTPAAPTVPEASPGDWPSRAADLVDTLVSLLRDKTVRPAALVARALVFGIIILASSLVVLTLVSIALIRVLTVCVFNGRVWAADFLVGALFLAGGFVVWAQRTASTAAAKERA